MKRIVIATLASSLLLGTAALAADDHPHGGGAHGGGAHGAESHAAPSGGFSHGGGMGGGMPSRGGFSHSSSAAPREHAPADFGPAAAGDRSTAEFRHPAVVRSHGVNLLYGNEGTHNTAMHHDARGFGTRPSNWNNRPRRFNRATYQRNFTASRRFHSGSYNRPSGWYYRRWAYGDYLPGIFWAQQYWLNDWWSFDLSLPPYGYEWVRYGSDALLVDVNTGQILEVEYDVFY